ncbi:MAG TPA: HEAT repeat domain-containing protein [Polyangiaceae bacterium]|jgi:HEAT repeat protein
MLAPPPLPRTLDAALRDLGSERAETRASAIADAVRHAALHDGVRARVLPLLETALKDDPAPGPRSAAAVGLGDLGAVEALPALLVAIEDADVHVRQMALNALGEIGDARAVPRLERALTDARPEVRYQAVIAYTKLASDAADVDRALARACSDADDAVRYIALRLAEERVDRPGSPAPSAELLAAARERLSKDAPHVALAAAILLAKVGEDAGREVIRSVVRQGRVSGAAPEKEDEREAVELAGALGLRDVVPDLERRAWGIASHVRDTCAWHAKIALARLGHERAAREILRDLDSPRAPAREAAVVAAGRARLEEAREKIAQLASAGTTDAQLAADALARLR